MRHRVPRRISAVLATALFLALAAYEVHHDLIQRAVWPGYGLDANRVVFIVAPLWVLGAVMVWVRRDWAWVGILAGVLASLAHGFGTSAGGARLGAVFVLAAPVLLVLSWFARGARPTESLAGEDRDAAAAAQRERRAVVSGGSTRARS